MWNNIVTIHLIAYRVVESIDQLSDNLLERLNGFVDEIENVSDDILKNAASKNIWKDLIDGKGKEHILKSSVESLQHLSGELESLSKYLENRYHDKIMTGVIKNLVTSLGTLSKSTSSGGVKKLFGGHESYVETLKEKYEEVMSRVRACRAAIKRLQETENPLKDFDSGPEE